MRKPHPDLHVAPHLRLPRKAATEKIAWLATTGAGKTHNASVLFEELVAASVPCCALDPIGVWWGLRSSASGERAALPVVIFGGDRGDVPITPEGGKVVADLVANGSEIPWSVIDLSGFESDVEMQRFMNDFARRLLYLARKPFHLFVDEADNFAPQQPFPEQRKLLGAMTKLVRQGRAKGLGVSLITQRPASLNKNVLSMCSTLFLMRIGATAPHDMKAVAEYWKYAKDANREAADQILGTLQTLQTGETWVYSPQFLGLTERARFRKRHTFDSSKTPEPGEEVIEPKRLAAVDLQAIEKRMAETIARVKAEDPKALQAENAQLRRELASAKAAKPAAAIPAAAASSRREDLVRIRQLTKTLEEAKRMIEQATSREITDPDAVDREAIGKVVQRAVEDLAKMFDARSASRSRKVAQVQQRAAALVKEIDGLLAAEPLKAPPAAPMPALARPSSPAPARVHAAAIAADVGDVQLKAGARRMLRSLASLHPRPMSRAQLGTLSDIKPRSGTFIEYFGTLRKAGLIYEDEAGQVGLTDAGVDAAGEAPAPKTTEELVAMWGAKLKRGARAMLGVAVAAYPEAVTRAELSEATGIQVRSGTFIEYLGALRSNGLIEDVAGGGVRASATLFVGGRG